jgi:hypothetical protein
MGDDLFFFNYLPQLHSYIECSSSCTYNVKQYMYGCTCFFSAVLVVGGCDWLMKVKLLK